MHERATLRRPILPLIPGRGMKDLSLIAQFKDAIPAIIRSHGFSQSWRI